MGSREREAHTARESDSEDQVVRMRPLIDSGEIRKPDQAVAMRSSDSDAFSYW